MPLWATIVTTIAAMLGGGFGARLLSLWSYRQQDDTRVRGELWREVGALREAARQQGERADRQAGKIEALEQRVTVLTVNRYGWRTLANSLRAEVLRLMSRMNECDLAAGRIASYDLAAEESRMVAAEKALDDGGGGE